MASTGRILGIEDDRKPIRILQLEAATKDAELVQAALEPEGLLCHITRVEAEPEFFAALNRNEFDLILADGALPSFDGISALRIAKKIRPGIPFIFVADTMSEEAEIEALKLGATDYIFKPGVSRIAQSIKRALREAGERAERKHADEALRRASAYLAEAQKLSHTGCFGWHVSSGKIYWSEETFRIFEFEPAVHITLERAFERIHPEDRQRVREVIDSAAAERKDFDFEHRLLMPDHSVRYVRAVGHPREESGDLEFVGAVTDITERKRAESLLVAEKRTLEMVANGSSLAAILEDLCCTIDAQTPGIISSVMLMDPDGMRLRPAPAKRLPSGWIDAINPAPIGPCVGSCGTAAFLKKRVIVSDIASDPLWADYRDLALSYGLRSAWSQPLISSNGLVLGTFGIYNADARSPNQSDLELIEAAGHIAVIAIERTRAEEALKRSEQSLRDVIETIPAMAWTTHADGARDFANQRWLSYTGPSPDEMAGTGWKKAFHPADIDRHLEKYRESLATGKPFENEARVRCAVDGRYRWFLHRAVALRDERGDIVKWYGTASDIEDLKQAEAKLRRDEEELRRITDAIPMSIVVLNPDGSSIYANQGTLDYTGLTSDDVIKKDFRERIFHPEDIERLRKSRQDSLNSNVPFENEQRALGRDGRYRWYLVRYNPLLNEAGEVVRWYATGTDIDDRKRSEDRTRNENIALRDEVDKASMFEELVGESPALQAVLTRVTKVAPSDSTILITGETGTGKELIARAVHKRSHRASRAFVNVNCAAIPVGLIGSELFGHEKGAFTGALQRRLGRFELAEGGTIFLDEIGELPMETQITILRVLQEREFERVGGNQTIRADVRVIAATNRDLQTAIATGAFRRDLFYRLNVVPIDIPPLRARKEDIPLLVEYFIDRYSRKAGRKIRTIENKTLKMLQSYSWPGNIRELQNVIERSVVISDGETLAMDGSWFSPQPANSDSAVLSKRIAAQEKEIIEAALAESKGRVSGPSGAAAKLGIPQSTLDFKIKSLKIDKELFKSKHPKLPV
jgi:formate hydrogenlyase transcriptional activator